MNHDNLGKGLSILQVKPEWLWLHYHCWDVNGSSLLPRPLAFFYYQKVGGGPNGSTLLLPFFPSL